MPHIFDLSNPMDILSLNMGRLVIKVYISHRYCLSQEIEPIKEGIMTIDLQIGHNVMPL